MKGLGECKIRKRIITICQVQRFKTKSTCVLVVIPFLTTTSYFFSGYYLWINYFKSCWLHSQGIYPVRLITYTNIQFKDKNKSLSWFTEIVLLSDIAVGAYNSDHAIVMWSTPLIDMSETILKVTHLQPVNGCIIHDKLQPNCTNQTLLQGNLIYCLLFKSDRPNSPTNVSK